MGFMKARKHERQFFVVDLMSKQRIKFNVFIFVIFSFNAFIASALIFILLPKMSIHTFINCYYVNFHVIFIVSCVRNFYGLILFCEIDFLYSSKQ